MFEVQPVLQQWMLPKIQWRNEWRHEGTGNVLFTGLAGKNRGKTSEISKQMQPMHLRTGKLQYNKLLF